MSDEGRADDEGTQEVSVSFPEAFLLDLLAQYPAAARPSQALRMAANDAMVRVRERGGSWGDVQLVRIEHVDEVSIGTADSVDVSDEGS